MRVAKLTPQSRRKVTRSGNDAVASAGAATGLELDWDIIDSGVGGEDVDDGREGVHL